MPERLCKFKSKNENMQAEIAGQGVLPIFGFTMVLKLIRTSFFIIIFLLNYTASCEVYIKASAIKGGIFVTPPVDLEYVEKSIRDHLIASNHFTIIDSNEYLLDIFIYQFAASYPTVSISLRKGGNIHHIDFEAKKWFGNRSEAIYKNVRLLVNRIPYKIDESKRFNASIGDLITESFKTPELVNVLEEGSFQTEYYEVLNFPLGSEPIFIVPDQFMDYFLTSFNILGLKRALKAYPIYVELKINDKKRFEMTGFETKNDLSWQQKGQILDLIDSFPLWNTSEDISGITLKLHLEKR